MINKHKLIPLLLGTVLISSWTLSSYAMSAVTSTVAVDSKMSIMPAPLPPSTDNIWSVEKNNRIEEDYTYNNTHFYTKKIKIKVSIKDEELAKYKKVYLVLSQPNYWGPVYYKAEDSTTTTQEATINTDEINKYLIRYDFKDKKIPAEFLITIADIKDKLSSEYWDSLTPELYAELQDWTEKRLTISNYSSIYLPTDTEQNKYNHLSNLGYSQNLQVPYYYGQSEKLNSIFTKLKEKNWVNYVTVLEKLEAKVTKLQSDIWVSKTSLVSKIQKESDFQLVVKPYFKLMSYESLYNIILEKIRQELQENMIDNNTDEIFWEYLK